ncbi:glyoxylate reductase [Xylariales sp. PMI_506]|nr:glyoxylate reductase [Xylariales sp. PMI_506]
MALQWALGSWWTGDANPTLAGHQLIIIAVQEPAPAWLDKVKKQYPGLDVKYYQRNPFGAVTTAARLDIDWSDATVLLTGPLTPKPEEAPKLQLVQLQSAGANYLLDSPLFKDTDVEFSTANGVHGPQIAEWVVTTFLASQHHLPYYLDNQKKGKWERSGTVQDGVGARVGILGYGSIGRQVARVAKALGMDVIAYTNGRRTTQASRRDTGYIVPGTGDPDGIFPSKWLSDADNQFEEFLSSDLDLLVVAVPLTPSTQGLISRTQFQLLSKKKTFLSNIARGPIVDTDALIEALDEGLIRGAALDVTDPEPLPEGHPLWSKPNTIITPHVSGNSNEYSKRVYEILELNLQKLSEGKKEFVNKVNKKQGY